MSVKIAFDTLPLKSGHAARGVGIYTKNLVEALKDIRILGYQDIRIDAFNFKTGNCPPAGLSADKAGEAGKLETGNYEIVHYPYFDLFFLTLPIIKPTKTVVTIHDVIPLVFPQHYPPGIRGSINLLVQKFSLRGVSAVITDSETSKKDIVKYLGYPKEKIHVVYPAPADIFRKLEIDDWGLEIKKKYHLPDKFILYVGDVNWNKNVLGLAEACKKIRIPLVMVGKNAVREDFDRANIENQPFVKLIEKYGEDRDILRLGFVQDEDLVKIYNLATVYCQPSFYEGFGMPVLEAMACGCPVVAAQTSSLPEICGNAAIMVDPYDDNDIAKKIDMAINDSKLREELVKKGFVQVKKFSWQKTAEEVIDVYQKVLAN